MQHHEGFPGAAHRHQHPGEQAELRQLVCSGLKEVIYGIYHEARRFLLRPLQVQRPFRQAMRGMGKFQDQEGGAGAKDHGRKRTAGRHIPRPRYHDGGGNAADGRGTISVSKTMQRANKDALEKLDPKQVYYTFPDRREGSKSSLILKKTKTKKSNRILYMTKPLKEELQAWLEKISQDEQNAPEKYSNCGQLFRLPDGLPIAPELLTKWYRLWRAEHPEFEQIVFHGLRHSSATYQLLQSDGDFKSVQGNTGHATASVLMDTYAHTQDKPRLELTEKIEANFYSQDLTPATPQSRQNEKPAATKISGKEILEAIRLMDADERRELTRALFA